MARVALMDAPQVAEALAISDLVRIHRVLLANASFRLWERWVLAQPQEVKLAIRAHERELAEQARAQALQVAGELDAHRGAQERRRLTERSREWRSTR